MKLKSLSYITKDTSKKEEAPNAKVQKFMQDNKLENDPLVERTLIEVQKSVIARFSAALEGKNTVEDVIGEAETIINDLPAIKEFVVPCFPPYFNIFEFYKNEYLERIEAQVSQHIPKTESTAAMDPGVLVVLASWFDNYGVLLGKLGIKEEEERLLDLQLVSSLVHPM